MLSGASENAHADSERTLLASRGDWEQLAVLGSCDEVPEIICED